MVKEVRDNLNCLAGDLILAVACIVYLPLRKLKLKKEVIDGIKKLLMNRLIEFHDTFMTSITRVQDAGMEDLNFVAIKQLENYPVLIVDPERRAGNFIFELDSHIYSQIETITTEKQNLLPNAMKKQASSGKEETKEGEKVESKDKEKKQEENSAKEKENKSNKLEEYE